MEEDTEEIQIERFMMKLLWRIEKRLCAGCGRLPAQKNRMFCECCQQLPRYQEIVEVEDTLIAIEANEDL